MRSFFLVAPNPSIPKHPTRSIEKLLIGSWKQSLFLIRRLHGLLCRHFGLEDQSKEKGEDTQNGHQSSWHEFFAGGIFFSKENQQDH